MSAFGQEVGLGDFDRVLVGEAVQVVVALGVVARGVAVQDCVGLVGEASGFEVGPVGGAEVGDGGMGVGVFEVPDAGEDLFVVVGLLGL